MTGVLFLWVAFALPQTQLDDTDMEDAIENEYRFDHAIDLNKIDVQVVDGIVELEGSVSNLKAKSRASKIAEMVKGVRAVSNRIEVDPPVVLSDDGIRKNVEQALFADPATDSYELAVIVADKVVTLTGTVDSHQEKMLAENVAASVKGVMGVNNDIDVNYQMDRPDSEIQEEIEALLKWDVLVDGGLIDVEVEEGHVELTGSVGSAQEKNHAFLTAWVSGVQSVETAGLEVKWWAKDEDLRQDEIADASDEEIEDAFTDAAIYDPRIVSTEVYPEAEDGWMTLRGTVDNLKSKIAAEKLAEHTAGVTGVTNRIKVRMGEPPHDEEIESKIELALANNSVTEAWEIDVHVNNGIVTLSGMVDSHLEKNEAEWTASGVQGVSEVNNIIDVNYPYSYYWWGAYPYYSLHITPPSDPAVIPDDDRIEERVANELWWSPFVDRDQVEITVEEGRVTLEGTVDSWREYRAAAENAWEGGALAVTNELAVR